MSGDDTINPELLLMVAGGMLEQVAWVFSHQRQEKLSVNNEQPIIETQWCNNDIYTTYIEKNSRFLLYLKARQMRYLASEVFLSN